MTTTTTMTLTAQGTQKYHKDKHYIELSAPLKAAPPVIVFFSFLDPTSYNWAVKHQVAQTIRKRVPAGTTIERFHAPLRAQPSDFAADLTSAWAVARDMQIDDQVIEPLFKSIQDDKTTIDIQGVKAVFDAMGIPPLRFDREASRSSVQREAKWMDEVARSAHIESVPAIIVDGKFLLRNEVFGDNVHAEKVADVIQELLNLKG